MNKREVTMSKKGYKPIPGFPGYLINKSGKVLQDALEIKAFNDGKCVNLKKDGVVYVKKVSDLLPKPSKVAKTEESAD